MAEDKYNKFLKFIKQCERLKSVPTEHYSPIEYSQSDFRNDVWYEDDIKRIVGRKYQYFLKNAYKFLNTYKFIAQRKKIVSFPIATHSKFLCSLFGSVCNVSNFISTLIDIDLLKCVDEKYHFNDSMKSKNYCRQYILNKRVQDLLISLFKKYNLRKPVTHNVNVFATEDESVISEEVLNNGIPLNELKVRFGRQNTKVNYDSIDDVIKYVENEGTDYLIHDYKEKVNKINSEILKDNETEQIHFNIKVKTNKKGRITNISSRAYNYLCFYKNHLERCKNKSGLLLKDYLDEKYKDGYLHYDSRASVYKVNYAMNHNGEWLGNDIDLYEELYGDSFKDKEERDSFKNTMMYIQFVKSVKQIKHFMFNKYPSLKNEYTDEELEKIIKHFKKRYNDIIGDSLYSKVFIYESCIYIDLYNELTRLGFNVSMIYDSFYIENNVISEYDFNLLCDLLLKNIVKKFYFNYTHSIKNIFKDTFRNNYINNITYNIFSIYNNINNNKNTYIYNQNYYNKSITNSNQIENKNSNIIIYNIRDFLPPKPFLIKHLRDKKWKQFKDSEFEKINVKMNKILYNIRKEKLKNH